MKPAFIPLFALAFLAGASVLPVRAHSADKGADESRFRYGGGLDLHYNEEKSHDAAVDACVYQHIDQWSICLGGNYNLSGSGWDEDYGVSLKARLNGENYLWSAGGGISYEIAKLDSTVELDVLKGGVWAWLNLVALMHESPEVTRHIRFGPVVRIAYGDISEKIHVFTINFEEKGNSITYDGGILFEYDFPRAENGAYATLITRLDYLDSNIELGGVDLDTDGSFSGSVGIRYRY